MLAKRFFLNMCCGKDFLDVTSFQMETSP